MGQGLKQRRSVRLRDYDYSTEGMYFVTIWAQRLECLFGEVVEDKMRLNQYGKIVDECWKWLFQQYSHTKINEFMIMPNHFHGIIEIIEPDRRGGSRTAPTFASCAPALRTAPTFASCAPAPVNVTKRKPLGRLIGAFKTVSTKRINLIRNTPGTPVWQRNYYEHVIRNEEELLQTQKYIQENPLKWDLDLENQYVAA